MTVGRRGHGLGHGGGAGDGLLVTGPLGLHVRPGEPGRDDEHGDADLQHEGLRRHAPARGAPSAWSRREASSTASGRENSMNTIVTLVTGRGTLVISTPSRPSECRAQPTEVTVSSTADSAVDAQPGPTPKRDRTHYLYVAVIVAMVAGILVGWALPRGRQVAQAARHRLRQPHQDDDHADHLLHDRPRHRLGPEGRPGRQGRRSRPRLLRHDVDRRARRSASSSATSSSRAPASTSPPRSPRAGRRRSPARPRRHGRLPPRAHPRHAGLRADVGLGAPGAAHRAPRRLRAAEDGQAPVSRSCVASSTSSASSSASWR